MAAIATLLVAGIAASAGAQTLTGTVVDGSPDEFFFTLADPGQARFTVVWEDAPSILALLVTCDDDGDTLTFATSTPIQDRILSADVGILPGFDCVALVDILVGVVTDYTINLQVSSPDGNILEMARLQPFTEDAASPRLLELAADLELRARALRAALNGRHSGGQP